GFLGRLPITWRRASRVCSWASSSSWLTIRRGRRRSRMPEAFLQLAHPACVQVLFGRHTGYRLEVALHMKPAHAPTVPRVPPDRAIRRYASRYSADLSNSGRRSIGFEGPAAQTRTEPIALRLLGRGIKTDIRAKRAPRRARRPAA